MFGPREFCGDEEEAWTSPYHQSLSFVTIKNPDDINMGVGNALFVFKVMIT